MARFRSLYPPKTTVGTGGYVVPGAPTTPVPDPIKTGGLPGGNVSFTVGGPTLQALQERRQRLQEQAPQLPEAAAMTSPWQGASYLANTLVNTLQQNRAAAEEERGQQEFAEAMSTGIDWTTGEMKPEALATIMTRNPEVGMGFIAEMIKSRREAAKTKAEQWVSIPTPEGESGQWYRNPVTGEEKKVGGGAPGGGGWKPSDLGALRDDYTKAATMYDSAAPSWQAMKEAAALSLNPEATVEGKGAADYSMIVGYAKLLDPNSVVREGEVKSASLTGGVLDQLNGWLNQWKSQGMLSDSVRRGIMVQANSRMKSYYDQAAEKRKWIEGIALRNNLNPDDIVPPLPGFQGWETEAPQVDPDDAAQDDAKYPG
jgi:hypothetical protein